MANADILIVRHPDAYFGLQSLDGVSSYGLTDKGKAQAHAVGEALDELGGKRIPAVIERAESFRSVLTALIIASHIVRGHTVVRPRREFTHSTLGLEELQERMQGRLFEKRDAGLYVACMSK